MRIEYQCSGGFGGLRLTYQTETETLPAAEAKMLMDLIKAANVFDLSTVLVHKNMPTPNSSILRRSVFVANNDPEKIIYPKQQYSSVDSIVSRVCCFITLSILEIISFIIYRK